MAVATHEDVAVSLGRSLSAGAEVAQVEWWLTGVELFITARAGDVALLNEALVKYVEVEAVVAKIRRHGTTESSVTVSVDDGTVTRRYENAVGAGDISDDLWTLLEAGSNTRSSSIRPGFQADSARWPAITVPAIDPDWTTP